MKNSIVFFIIISSCMSVFAQTETFDITTYTPPKGWKKEIKETVVVFTYTNAKDKSWAQIGLYKNINSKGTIDDDFNSAWDELVAKPYKIKELPLSDSANESKGWKVKTGAGKYLYNKSTTVVLLTAFTGYNKTVDVITLTNAKRHIETFEKFIESININSTVTSVPSTSNNNTPVSTTTTTNNGSFTYSTTNFDDGWVSSIKEDWVEVAKGNIKVLIHYPNAKVNVYNSVLKDGDYNAWNNLVANRYSNLKNLEWKSIQSWQSITFMEGDATENATGKPVHIVLFKEHISTGNGRYLEFVTDSKATYENEFGPYHKTEFDWEKNADMQYRNKFAVAPNDLLGTWSANDYASLSYYYVNSGGYAGATATSTAIKFTFKPGNNYESDQSGADGVVGNQKFFREVFKGKVTVNTWQLSLTNRFKGATDNFYCQFEAIKGGRILLLNQISDGFKSSYSLVKKMN